MSLRTMIDAERAGGMEARIGLRLGVETVLAHFREGRPEIAAGPIETADLVLAGTPPLIAAAIYGGQPLAALEAGGLIAVTGDRALAERFVTLFPLPPKAPLPQSSP